MCPSSSSFEYGLGVAEEVPGLADIGVGAGVFGLADGLAQRRRSAAPEQNLVQRLVGLQLSRRHRYPRRRPYRDRTAVGLQQRLREALLHRVDEEAVETRHHDEERRMIAV